MAPTTVLARTCAALNAQVVRYLVVGDRALQLEGRRTDTLDIALFLDPATENLERVFTALATLGHMPPAGWLATEVSGREVMVVGRQPEVALIMAPTTAVFAAEADRSTSANLEGVRIPFRHDLAV